MHLAKAATNSVAKPTCCFDTVICSLRIFLQIVKSGLITISELPTWAKRNADVVPSDSSDNFILLPVWLVTHVSVS